ncbi:helix-turn-helix transcriptional regulator [Streptomyces sp. 2A115]|uniref:helix-turn-helix transcriptional regulator n=1 Tax=Streptomyces sp. 2A115 TaxID=3457439 RepID=UPI003FCF6844
MPIRTRIKQKAPAGCLRIEGSAPYLGLKLTTLRKWRLLGKGPTGFKIGRHIAYRIADLDAYLEDQYQRP